LQTAKNSNGDSGIKTPSCLQAGTRPLSIWSNQTTQG
jgi:hypothetical protein